MSGFKRQRSLFHADKPPSVRPNDGVKIPSDVVSTYVPLGLAVPIRLFRRIAVISAMVPADRIIPSPTGTSVVHRDHFGDKEKGRLSNLPSVVWTWDLVDGRVIGLWKTSLPLGEPQYILINLTKTLYLSTPSP